MASAPARQINSKVCILCFNLNLFSQRVKSQVLHCIQVRVLTLLFDFPAEYSKCSCEQNVSHRSKCSVISAKVTYNTSQETRDPDKLWLEICAKRDACDKAMKKIKEMAFFLSSVAVVEKKVQENECEKGKNGDEETVNNNSQRKKKIYWPAISYWIALQSRDGLRMSTIPVRSALLDTGMEVTAKSVQECSERKGRKCSRFLVHDFERPQ